MEIPVQLKRYEGDDAPEDHDRTNEAVMIAATVGVVAVGAALFEIALLPGIAIGVATMLVPKYLPKMGSALTPMFRSSVRGAYKLGRKTREMIAEAREQMQDIAAGTHAEGDGGSKVMNKSHKGGESHESAAEHHRRRITQPPTARFDAAVIIR